MVRVRGMQKSSGQHTEVHWFENWPNDSIAYLLPLTVGS